ncbi:MAG TPA: hypothetical protein VGW10_15250, partial [Solirubrobacteraceae bacterium]|nr:hypothetical protein [Solirubrobacteraceae bacterium]
MTGPVTALGIRDGDPAVLRALIARRGSAVLAYCERACAPAQVPNAAAEAFARFRALVVAAPRPADLDPEAALLSSTRHAAADRAPRGHAPPSGAGLGRLLGGRATADQISLVPQLLIARADGTLDGDGEEQLNRLLDASAAARAAEERFRAAEHAYRSAPPRPIPDDIGDTIVEAMSAVPADPAPVPEAPAFAPDPPPPPAGEAAAPEEPAAAAPEEPDAIAPEEPDAPAPEEPAVGAPEEPDAPAPEPVAPQADPVESDEVPVETEAVPKERDVAASGAGVPEDNGVAAPEEDDVDVPIDADDEEEVEAERVVAGAVASERAEPAAEWSVPPEEIGHDEALDVEIAAARLRPPPADEEVDDRTGAAAARLQTGSGAVDEPLVEAPRVPPRRVAG